MKYAIKMKDRSVSIMTLLTDTTIEAEIDKFHQDIKDQIVSHREITDDKIPQDRTFRDAWTDDLPTDSIDVDVNKAKELHKVKLRALRKPLLEALDVDYQKADEAGDLTKKSQIASKKQALRDVTKVALPDDLEDLKDFIPDILK